MEGLALDNVTVKRGGFPIVRNVSLTAPQGVVTVLLGPNGAGKTTLLEAISGVIPCAAGAVTLSGQPIQALPRPVRARLGMAHVEQGRAVFAQLTVEENMLAASRDRQIERAYALFPELGARRKIAAGMLSGGEQQMLVIARALLSRPKMMLIDELSLGLAPIVVQRLIPALRRLTAEGVGILLVEQYAWLALRIGDRAYVLSHGEIVLHDACVQLLEQPERLHEAYLA